MSTCHCCCKRPATKEAALRQVTWKQVCDECWGRFSASERANYVPPDGRDVEQRRTNVESKTIRVKRHPNALNRYESTDGSCVITLSGPAFQHDEFDITPVKSDEERLREARLSAVLDCMHIAGNSENVAAFIVQTIERVDAEFEKGERSDG